MSSDATLGVETRARKKKRERRDETAANAGEAIPGLLNDIVVTHVLRSENFDDPADLARLPAVSRAMRDAVAATGLQFEELDEYDASMLGCLSALQRLQRGGHLSRQEYLCEAAARSGQLEELKVLRAERLPVGRVDVRGGGEGRAPRGAAVGTRERLPVGHTHVPVGGVLRAPRDAAVGAGERLSVGRVYVLGRGGGRAPRGAAVGARERLPVDQTNALNGETRGPSRVGKLGGRERLP